MRLIYGVTSAPWFVFYLHAEKHSGPQGLTVNWYQLQRRRHYMVWTPGDVVSGPSSTICLAASSLTGDWDVTSLPLSLNPSGGPLGLKLQVWGKTWPLQRDIYSRLHQVFQWVTMRRRRSCRMTPAPVGVGPGQESLPQLYQADSYIPKMTGQVNRIWRMDFSQWGWRKSHFEVINK